MKNEKYSYSDRVLIAIRKIIRSVDLHSRALITKYGLTGPQLIVLSAVVGKESTSIGDIAKKVSLSQGTVTVIVDRLEKGGFLLREKSNEDRRRVLVSSTDKGRKIIDEKPSLLQERFISRFSKLPEWEQTMIISSFTRVVDMMEMVAETDDSSPLLTNEPLDSLPVLEDHYPSMIAPEKE